MPADFLDATSVLIRTKYIPKLVDLTRLINKGPVRSRIPISGDNVQGRSAVFTFFDQAAHAGRPVGYLGWTPVGGTVAGKEQSYSLGRYMIPVTLELMDELNAKNQIGFLSKYVPDQMRRMAETTDLLFRTSLLTTEQGILGEVASVSGNTVTLEYTSGPPTWYNTLVDVNRPFHRNIYVQAYTSAGVARGTPRLITNVIYESGTITLDSTTGLADGDYFVMTDAAGQEDTRGSWGPGLLDAIDDDNTFQGMNRASAGNERYKCLVETGSAAITSELIANFAHKVQARYQTSRPAELFCGYFMLEALYNAEFRGSVVLQQNMEYNDNYRSLRVRNVKLTEDHEMFNNRLLAIDFSNLQFACVNTMPVDGEWKRLEGRPIKEYLTQCYFRLIMFDPTSFARRDDITLS
jgi:hypothetical protein